MHQTQSPEIADSIVTMQNSTAHWVTVYIGLGSNLENPSRQIQTARFAITQINRINELAFSSLYVSAPMGPQNQPDYVNAVMSVTTDLPPIDLLHCLQAIENAQGRVRKGQRWGARTLDLDILLYGDMSIDLPELIVPHPGLIERSFVLQPLFEITPQVHIPGKGNIADLLVGCPMNGLKRL